MAKFDHTGSRSSNASKSDTRKAATRKNSTATTSPQPSTNTARGAALHALDEFHNLRASFLAFGCVQSFLSPHYRQEVEEFHIEPGELRSLVTVIHMEIERRIEAVGDAIQAVRKALP